MPNTVSKVIIFLILCSIPFIGVCQTDTIAAADYKLKFLEPAPTFHKPRFFTTLGIGTVIYGGTIIALDQIWYSQYEQTSFHTFNDWGEWEDMDKVGHFFGAYMESHSAFLLAQWMGMKRSKSRIVAASLGMVYQATFEVMDGYSKKWGFSFADIGFNTAGSLAYFAQDLAWEEQRIKIKVSSKRINYPSYMLTSVDNEATMDLQTRAGDLYAGNLPQRYLKDYNAQTLWASANIHSFMKNKDTKFPKWLNVAVGYGAQNMFGGFENEWEHEGRMYRLNKDDFPRYRQFYFSFDIDIERINTKNRFLKTFLRFVNLLKVPAPALEINTLGKVKFHPFHY